VKAEILQRDFLKVGTISPKLDVMKGVALVDMDSAGLATEFGTSTVNTTINDAFGSSTAAANSRLVIASPFPS